MPLFGRTTQMLMDVREATKSNPRLLVIAHNDRFAHDLAHRFCRLADARFETEHSWRFVVCNNCRVLFNSASHSSGTAGCGFIAPVFVDHAVRELCNPDQLHGVAVLLSRIEALLPERPTQP